MVFFISEVFKLICLGEGYVPGLGFELGASSFKRMRSTIELDPKRPLVEVPNQLKIFL